MKGRNYMEGGQQISKETFLYSPWIRQQCDDEGRLRQFISSSILDQLSHFDERWAVHQFVSKKSSHHFCTRLIGLLKLSRLK